jgi:DNA-binding transcriptional regulator GbsR (MarR family)
MKLEEAKDRFVQIWGTVGVEWGINRTMAQVHALLLASSEALSTDDVMEGLNISRGNANMNLRDLVNWGLIYRENVPGDRKDYFVAEKDVWEVAQKIVAERKRRELDPMMKMLEQLLEESSSGKQQSIEFQHFNKLLSDIHDLGQKSRSLLELVLRLDQSAFFKPLKALLRGK